MKNFTITFLLLFSAALYADSDHLRPYRKSHSYPENYCTHQDLYNKKYSSPRESVRKFLKAYGTNYQQALFDAAKHGYSDFLEPIIDLGARINGSNNQGKTALIFAAEAGNSVTCKALIALGAHVDARTRWDSTALMYAAQNGHKKACKVLIFAGAKVSACTDVGKTALMYAAEGGHTDICKLLLKHNAFVDARTNWGSTALMWAAQKGHKETCRLLLHYGANVHAKTNEGKIALMYAKGHKAVADLLRNAGAYSVSDYKPTVSNSNPNEFGDGFFVGAFVGSLATYCLNNFF